MGFALRRFESSSAHIYFCESSSVVELQPSKLVTRVRFPSLAPFFISRLSDPEKFRKIHIHCCRQRYNTSQTFLFLIKSFDWYAKPLRSLCFGDNLMKVTLLIPTLNEINGMKSIMPKISPDWYDQLLIVDGKSTDGTIEYCHQMNYPLVIQQKKGMRHAYMEALPHITGDVILTFSPDGNSIPELIPECIAKLKEGYDMVIVSRYAKGAKSYDDDPITAFGNKMFTLFINLFHRAHYTDAMVIYRAYYKKLIFDLDLDKNDSYAFEENLFKTLISWEPLLSIRAAKRKLRIAEIPGDEPAREGGERKLQVLRWGAAYLLEVFREIFLWR
jgi:glycosyltransferase involved in cell wall biosynthesis